MSCCCNDIFTCHAELVHHAGEIQYPIIPFEAQDWQGTNMLRVPMLPPLGLNEVGPHAMPPKGYVVQVYKRNSNGEIRLVELGTVINRTTGLITLLKAGRVEAFAGWVEVR
jgi:hypothetical protein